MQKNLLTYYGAVMQSGFCLDTHILQSVKPIMVMALAWEYWKAQSSAWECLFFRLDIWYVIAASIQFCFDHQKSTHTVLS